MNSVNVFLYFYLIVLYSCLCCSLLANAIYIFFINIYNATTTTTATRLSTRKRNCYLLLLFITVYTTTYLVLQHTHTQKNILFPNFPNISLRV